MNSIDWKIYTLNSAAFLTSMANFIEPAAKVLLIFVSIGYTVHKWYILSKKGKSDDN